MSGSNNRTVLAALPADVTRVQVIDEFGKTKYKKPSEVADTDQIVRSTNGDPIVMSGRPGRKKKPSLQPAHPQVEEMLRAKELHFQEDELLDTVRQDPEGRLVLNYVLEGLAAEAASLEFERKEAERNGQPTSQISMRRVNALKSVGDAWLKRQEQTASTGVDLESKAFRLLFQFIMDTLREAMDELELRPEMIETIFTNFSRRLGDDWNKEAIKRMEG